MPEKPPAHLKYPDLQTSAEVSRAVKRHDRLKNEKIPNDPAARIEVYMGRLEKVFLNPEEGVRKRNIEMLREHIYDAFIIKRENVPESYFELQKQVARERGERVDEIPKDVRERMIDIAIEDQKASLDAWVDYLSSDDAVYPTWYKYIVFRNIVKLSQFDKELGKFKTRTDSTVAPFPDVYREPLAQMADIYEKVAADNKALKDPVIGEAFAKKFPSLYAELIQQSIAATLESKEETRGEWIKYPKGERGAAQKLYESLEGKGTGWCTAGRSTAEIQVSSGDFYVYYTNDSNGVPSQPRVAIRMHENKIAEVRGILTHQAVEPQMNEILEAKLQEFGPEADAYKKKSHDMRLLTQVEKKTQAGEQLTQSELIFLYEINSHIDGFGYKRDPRIDEIRNARNPKDDAPLALNCAPGEIAWSKAEYDKNPSQYKSYIGPLFEGIFQSSLENIYISFPEGRIGQKEIRITIGGKDRKKLELELKKAGIVISSRAQDIMRNKVFAPGKSPEQVDLVILTVDDLGFPNGASTDEIYAHAEQFGLALCPPDTGPQLRLQYMDQPQGESLYVGMKQITDSVGNPSVLNIGRDSGVHWLGAAGSAESQFGWDPVHRFVFRKLAPSS